MNATFAALRFLAATTVRPASDAPGQPITLDLPGLGPCEADRYAPDGPPAGTLLFVHGMSPMGRRDPRMCRAGRALAAAGFQVVTPRVPDMEELRLDARSVDHIEACIRAVQAAPGLGDGRPIGLFSISSSAGLSLIASARPGVAPLLSAICALGTYTDSVRWARYVFYGSDTDEYPRLILLRNLIELVHGPRPELIRALDVALLDHWHRRPSPEWPGLLARLNEPDRALAQGIREDRACWERLAPELLARGHALLAELDLTPHVRALTTPLVLLHGRDDRVIPASESEALARAIQAAGGQARLVITPLLDHGDAALSLRTLPELVEVIGAFRAFFRRVAG